MGYAQLIIQRDRATTTGDAARIAELEASLAAGTLEPPADSGVAALGAEITLRDARGYVRVVRLVTAGEVGLVPRGASPASPVGAAVLGARVGQDVELEGAELSVVKIAWP